MKTLLISLALSCLAIPAFAESPNPENFCQTSGGCTDAMKALMTEFREQGVKPDLSAGPMVASGGCFHFQSGVNPKQEHHALLVLDPTSSPVLFQAVLSFYAATNPYAGFTFEKATAYAKSRGSQPKETVENLKDYETEYKSAEYDIFYWERALPGTNQILFVSTVLKNGYNLQYAFCRLNKHENP